MVQKGILVAKIKKLVGREDILEEIMKREITIIHGQFTDIALAEVWGYRKYEAIERYKYVIEMLKIIKGVMFKFYGNEEINQVMWEAQVSVFR